VEEQAFVLKLHTKSQYGYFSVVVEEPAIMLKLHTMSQYGSYRVVSTNHHTHFFSMVVSGGTSYHAKTAHQVSVWLI